MRLVAAFLALSAALPAVPAAAQPQQTRIALVIGNTEYRGDLRRLPNASRDADLISDVLMKAGFEVIELPDADRGKMDAAISDFRARLRNARPGAVALFYFAGHGLQSLGTNYLMATDATVKTPDDISRSGIEADKVLWAMVRGGEANTNILILDACRPNNNASKELRSVAEEGLSEMDARGLDPERNVMIAFSTGLGQTAPDGEEGENSPFTRTLAENILVPDVAIEILLRRVSAKLVKEGYQKPWYSSGMLDPFAFVGEAE
jgi:uncharacterized caspase-like protein